MIAVSDMISRFRIRRWSITALVFSVMVSMAVFSVCASSDTFAAAEWYRFQNSDENNGVTPVEMAGSYDEAALKWGRQMVEGYTTSFTPPLIIDGYLYTASNKKIYKIDKETGETVKTSAEMLVNVSYAMHPMTYSEETGCLYVPLLNGRVQCVDAESLTLKWISKTYTGTQALSPIAYKDGKVYTGIWSSEITDGVYFALDAETGETVWEFRPSELETVEVAEDLGEFRKPTGQTKPDNFYTYTALITVKPKNGFSFDKDAFGRYWLFDSKGSKYVPEGMDGNSMTQSTVNGNGTTYEYNSDGTVTIRAKFDCYEGKFTQSGSSDQQSSVMIEGLDAPIVGKPFDTTAETDSNVTIESIEWKRGDIPHGFYWAGAYVNDDYLVFGSDDAQNNTFGEAGASSYTGTATLYSLDRRTGAMVDKIDGCIGDIRSTIVYNDGYVYFTSKGGRLYKVKLKSDGKFDHSTLSYFQMDGMMTASPVVHGGRIYVGVSGTGGQFNADGGHMFAVLRDSDMLTGSYDSNNPYEYNGSLVYTTQIAGYPQASPLLSTTAPEGKVRLYFTFNAFPGGIYFLEDSPSSTGEDHTDAALLFKPEQAMRQYCISPLCVDSDGTIYIKNDSGYLMAICLNKAYLPTLDPDAGIYGIKVTSNGEELEWDEPFTSGTLNYRLRASNEAESADIELDVPEGMTASIDGNEYKGGKYSVPVSEEMSAVTVTVSKNVLGKLYKRTYTLNIGAANNNANLAGLYINDSNTAPSFIVDYSDQHTNTKGIGFDPVFDAGTQKYVSRTYGGSKTFVNVWVKTDDPEATVKCFPVDSVGNVLAYTNDDGSLPNKGTNGNIRFPVYWIKGSISAEVKIVVTPPSGKEEAQKEYNVELVRSEENTDIGNDVLNLTVSSKTLYTSGSDRSVQVKAKYGEKDVTASCTWYSSRPDIATVDSKGNVAAQNKQGDAVIWASYGAQDTEDRPCVIRVRNADCAEPLASLTSGTYYTQRKVEFYTSTAGADIYYTIGTDGANADKPDKNSTKYTGPVTLGEPGTLKRYRIKAIAAGDGLSSSIVSDFDYTVDLRKQITSAEIEGLDKPEEGEPFDTDVTLKASAEDESNVRIVCESLKWYRITDSGEEEVTGKAENGEHYRARLVLRPDDISGYLFSKSMLVNTGERFAELCIDEDGKAEAAVDFDAAGKVISEVTLTGIAWPEGLQGFDGSSCSASDGVKILKSDWKTTEGNDVPKTAQYNTTYILKAVMSAEEGYDISDDIRVNVNRDGAVESIPEGDIVRGEDGTYTVTVRHTTDKVKVDSSEGTCLSAETGVLLEFDNLTPVDDLKRALNFSVTVKALAENGEEFTVPAENVYWDEDEISKVYDPNAINECSFNAIGKVTLPEELDPDGSSLIVIMPITVRRGAVADPVMSPGPGTYASAQTIRMSSATRGAAIIYTRSDQPKETSITYEDPVILSGVSGKKTTYIFKMFATAYGVKSKTVQYKIVIDRTPEAADASKNSKDSITPNEVASQAAAESKSIGKVSMTSCVPNEKKKGVSLKFKKVKDALNYRVEYRKAGSSTWYYLWTKGKKSAAIGGLAKGAMYEFRISAYNIESGFWQRGQWSASQYQYIRGTTLKLAKDKKFFTAKVSKAKNATGYKVKYSLKKNMKGAKTKNFKGWKKTKLKVKKLKAKKNYYVQVCPYKKSEGKVYTGAWTSVKIVKIK